VSGEIFDPEIHAVDKNGEPSLNKDGSFRKKRKDAGKGAAASAARPASPAGKAAADRREGYRKSVEGFAALPVTALSMADPVMGWAAGQLAPLWAEALADLAMEQPRLAVALERAGSLGAVGGLLGVGVLTVVQFGTLAGKVPDHVAAMVGAKSREDIERIIDQRATGLVRDRKAAEAEAEAAQRAAADAEHAAADHQYAEAV
jgi:hypothetical protein